MKKFYDTVLGSDGSPLVGASVTVYQTGTTTKPTIYSDNGVTPASNPLSTNERGLYQFYVADGNFDLVVEKSGYGSFTLTNVEVDERDTAGTISFTPTGGIAANTVAGALAELDGDIATLTASKANSVHGHAATDISFTPTGNIASVTVAAALAELDSEKAQRTAGTYTPTWGADVAPSLGNGTLSGTWARNGNVITATVMLTVGSTTTFGTGQWTFSLPVAAKSAEIGSILLYDNGTVYKTGICVASASGGAGIFCIPHDGALACSGSAPFAWAAGDLLRATITYEAA